MYHTYSYNSTLEEIWNSVIHCSMPPTNSTIKQVNVYTLLCSLILYYLQDMAEIFLKTIKVSNILSLLLELNTNTWVLIKD